MKTSIHNLIPKDFYLCPVWQPVDDLEDTAMEVAPFQGDNFHMEEMYLVGARFNLADGSRYDGFVRYSWGTPITISLVINDLEFASFSAQRSTESEEGHIEFAQKLGKQVDAVFPINYTSKVKLYLQSAVY